MVHFTFYESLSGLEICSHLPDCALTDAFESPSMVKMLGHIYAVGKAIIRWIPSLIDPVVKYFLQLVRLHVFRPIF